RIDVDHGNQARAKAVVLQQRMPSLVGRLVAIKPGQTRRGADGAGFDDDLVNGVDREISFKQPGVEGIRLESDDLLDAVVLGGVNGVPAEICADIDDNARRRLLKSVADTGGQFRLDATR